jgi:hypothetical protein
VLLCCNFEATRLQYMGHKSWTAVRVGKAVSRLGSGRFFAIARRIDGTKFAPVIAQRSGGKWCLADLPDGSMAEIEIKRWMDIPPLRRARKRVLRPRRKEQGSSFRW